MRATPPVLYHYTCRDHGVPGIARDGELRPRAHPCLPELGPLLWLTDVESFTTATPEHLGLQSSILACDRTAVRYALDSKQIDGLAWWPKIRRRADPIAVATLQLGRWPSRWWVATEPIDEGAILTVALMTERGAVYG